ncbi:hypothetical protein KUV47_02220 [Vannielia litorea]|uniref:hypothetical protein n=1 Tax=Vannielia litorea TaxID=1217970 RepID=UPI001C95F8C2|nr:hypothetical protein [Vannielia litorea]MBY6152015.1 hypothetical protein [Vannielia litorea]
MDWALILSMPLMLLLGFIGDAASRDEDDDEALGEGNLQNAEEDAAVAARAAYGEDMLALMAEDAELAERAEPVAEEVAEAPEDEGEPDVEPEPEALETAVKPAAVPVGESAESEAAEVAEEDSEAQAAEETLAEAEDEGSEDFSGFDVEEDVLVFEAPGASEAEPEFEASDEGLTVRMAGQEAFLPGVTELPEGAVVGVEPATPST